MRRSDATLLVLAGAIIASIALMYWWTDDETSAPDSIPVADSETVESTAAALASPIESNRHASTASTSLAGRDFPTQEASPTDGSASSPKRCARPKSEPRTEETVLPLTFADVDLSKPYPAKDVHPIDDGCKVVAHTLRMSVFIFDVVDTQVVMYGGPRFHENHPRAPLNPILLADRLCTGTRPFDSSTVPKHELVAVTENANATIYLGDTWVSDGVIVSSLTESEYRGIEGLLLGRRRSGPGPSRNMYRKGFDTMMASHALNRKVAAKVRDHQSNEELRRAQRPVAEECRD